VPSLHQRAARVERCARRLEQSGRDALAGVHHRLPEPCAHAAAHELLGDDVAVLRRPHVEDRRRAGEQEIEQP